jgi:hypothetical protein
MFGNDFINVVRKYFELRKVPFERVESYLNEIVSNEQIITYFITKGNDPENPDVILDLAFIIGNVLFGISVSKDYSMTLFRRSLKEFDTIEEEIHKETIGVRFDSDIRGGWAVYVEKNEADALRKFIFTVTKIWKNL